MSAAAEMKEAVSLHRVWTRLLPVLKLHWEGFAWGFAFIVLSTVAEVLAPVVIGKAVDTAMGGVQKERLWQLCGLYLALIVVKASLEVGQAFLVQSTGQRVVHDLRVRLFQKILWLPVPYFDRHPTGRLLTRVINDIKSLSELFTASISVLALDCLIIIGTIAAMFWLDFKLAGLVLLTFPAVVWTIHHFGEKLADAYRSVRQKLSEINAFLGENIGALATIQRLGAEAEREGKFTAIVQAHEVAQMRSLGVFATVQPLANVLNGIAMGTLLGVGGLWVIQGRITVGVLVAFLAYLRNLFQPVRDLVEKYNTFLSAKISAERVVDILEEAEEPRGGASLQESPVESDIRFSGVSFTYPGATAPALEGINFWVPQGKSFAVVGATGSGKSSLIRLLLAFYPPSQGQIEFGGRALAQWSLPALRRSIGVVHQDIYLFQGTLRDNLTLGDLRWNDSYLRDQCERAQLWNLIKHRGGLDMVVQEGGTNLSLGEKQLISFARVLVLDTPVLILDEATSSMDRILERRLLEAVREALEGRTSLVIAHRLSTIKRCDRVLVLERGRLLEEGAYDDLVALGGAFAQLHARHH